ncbi:MAG: hypothetical protein KAX49_04130 [Halanaerobiales bacterium]|nr:hypothetical protein [Halanaerobiales bacterium]
MTIFERHPFNRYGSIVRLFENKKEIARRLINKVKEINSNALDLQGA